MFCYKMHPAGDEKILAICDKSVLGETFEEKDLCIEVSREFYFGAECGEEEALKLIRSATIVNAIGEGIISLMLKNDVIRGEMVLRVKGVPHAQAIEA
jgi:hypothetical protein